MKRFFRRLFFFILLCVIPLYVLDYVYSRIVASSSNKSIECWAELMEDDINADCIVLGSSRAMNHIIPSVVDSILGSRSFNLGEGGAHMDEIYMRYHLYRKRNMPASLVLVNIDHSSLSPQVDFDRYQYFPWFWNKTFREEMFPIKPFTFAERILPLYRYRGTRLLGFHRGPKMLERGWSRYEGDFHDEGFEDRVYAFTKDDAYEKYLDSLLEELRSDGAQVVFFISPYYKDVLEKMSGMDQMREYYDSLSRSRGLTFLDYSEIPISQDSSFFSNPMHLNARGDTILTRSVAYDIKAQYSTHQSEIK